MVIFFKSISAIVPAFLLIWYVHHYIPKTGIPHQILWKAYLKGIFMCICILSIFYILEIMGFDVKSRNIISSFFTGALTEEVFRFLFIWLILRKHKELSNQKCFLVLISTYISMGYAGFENLIFILKEENPFLFIIRGYLSVPGHLFYGIVMVHLYSLMNEKDNPSNFDKAKIILIPSILHHCFNTMIICRHTVGFITIVLLHIYVYYLWRYCLRILKGIEPAHIN